MKLLLIGIIASLITFACKDNKQPACICTTEFRLITAEITDSLNRPLNELQTRTIAPSGTTIIPTIKKLDFLPNVYVIADDSNLNSFSTAPTVVLFIVSDSIKSKTFQYVLNTDECRCHIHKLSGPNKIIF